MTKTFANYPALTEALQFDLADQIKAADWGGKRVNVRLGGSQQSCSAYVTVSAMDQDGEFYVDENGDSDISVRFSDHADRHGSSITVRVDNLVSGEEKVEISDDDYEACIAEATAFVRDTLASMEIDA